MANDSLGRIDVCGNCGVSARRAMVGDIANTSTPKPTGTYHEASEEMRRRCGGIRWSLGRAGRRGGLGIYDGKGGAKIPPYLPEGSEKSAFRKAS